MEKAVLVTGGAKRLGRALAVAMAEDGFDVAIHYQRSEGAAEETVTALREKGVRSEKFQCDFGDPKAVSTLISRVISVFPDLTVLINSASIFERGPFLEGQDEDFDRQFHINFRTPFILTRDFARQARAGLVINMLDTHIQDNVTGYFVYSLTKKSLQSLTEMSAKALGPDIRVNGIAPGLILPSKDVDQETFERMARKIPLKRSGGPEDIVQAARYFVSQSFITGQVLYVDGGEHVL